MEARENGWSAIKDPDLYIQCMRGTCECKEGECKSDEIELSLKQTTEVNQ